jgi:hypothetical protein
MDLNKFPVYPRKKLDFLRHLKSEWVILLPTNFCVRPQNSIRMFNVPNQAIKLSASSSDLRAPTQEVLISAESGFINCTLAQIH